MTSRPPAEPGALARRLGTADAVVVGLGAMLGAGVFAAFGPAAAAAGPGWWLLAALGVASVVAFCNAVASAQLAAVYPSSGGTYLFGREVLGPWWGFLAGWGFVVGKSASCAAMAMTFAAYAVPSPGWTRRLVALAGVVALTGLNLRGITKTAVMARVLLAVVLVVLVGFVVAAWVSDPVSANPGAGSGSGGVGIPGILQAAGLLFFALAGYARIATLAEEVRRPEMIGRAILFAFAVAVLLYAAVGATLVRVLGADLAGTPTAVADAAAAAGPGWLMTAVRVGAVAASLGALLALITGVSRTMLAMAREGDLPGGLSSVSARYAVPHVAEILVGALVVGLVLVADLRGAIGFSSFGVLTYYFVANASAWRQPAAERRWPRWLNVLGMTGCVVLVASLPRGAVSAGVLVLAVGILGRWVVLRRRHP